MEQKSAKTKFSLPDLIIRIGAGTPLVSNNYLYYVASNETPPLETDLHETRSFRTFETASQMRAQSSAPSREGSILGDPDGLHAHLPSSSPSFDGTEDSRDPDTSAMAQRGQDIEHSTVPASHANGGDNAQPMMKPQVETHKLAHSVPQQQSSSGRPPDPVADSKGMSMKPPESLPQPSDALSQNPKGYHQRESSALPSPSLQPPNSSSQLPTSSQSPDRFVPLVEPRPQVSSPSPRWLDHSSEVPNVSTTLPDQPSGPSIRAPELSSKTHEKSASQLTEPSPQLPPNPAATPMEPHGLATGNADREKTLGGKKGMWDYFSIPKRFVLQPGNSPGTPAQAQEPQKAAESSPKGHFLVTPTLRPESAQVRMVPWKVESAGNEPAPNPSLGKRESGVLVQEQGAPAPENGSVPDMTIVGQSEDRVPLIPKAAQEMSGLGEPRAAPMPSAATEQGPMPGMAVSAGQKKAEDPPASSRQGQAAGQRAVTTLDPTEQLQEMPAPSGQVAPREMQEPPVGEERGQPLEMAEVTSGPVPDMPAATGPAQQLGSGSVSAGPKVGEVSAPVEHREAQNVSGPVEPGRFYEVRPSSGHGPPLEIPSSVEDTQPQGGPISTGGSQWTTLSESPHGDAPEIVTAPSIAAMTGDMSGPFSRGDSSETLPEEKIPVLGQETLGRPEFERGFSGKELELIPENGIPVPREEVVGGGNPNLAAGNRPKGILQRVKSVPGGRPVTHAPMNPAAQVSSSALPVRNPTPAPRARNLLSDIDSEGSVEKVSSGPGRGRLLMRKARNGAMRPMVLRGLLGRQLAGPAKATLRALAKGESPVLTDHGLVIPGA